MVDRERGWCSCPDHLHRGSARHQCKHGIAVALTLKRGVEAEAIALAEVTRYVSGRFAGDADENVATIRARMAKETEMAVVPDTMLAQLRSAVEKACLLPRQPGKAKGITRGPAVAEKKTRHLYRRKEVEDTMRPADLTGGSNRGRGARATVDASKLGHAGGRVAKARRKETKKKKAKAARAVLVKGRRVRNPQVIAGVKRTAEGGIAVSVQPPVVRQARAPTEGWMSRLMAGRFVF